MKPCGSMIAYPERLDDPTIAETDVPVRRRRSGCPWPGPFDGDSTLDARLRLLIEPVPAIVWTTDRELRFTSGLGSGRASFGLRADPRHQPLRPLRHPRPRACPSAPTSSRSAASR